MVLVFLFIVVFPRVMLDPSESGMQSIFDQFKWVFTPMPASTDVTAIDDESEVCFLLCTMYSVQCTMCTVQCTKQEKLHIMCTVLSYQLKLIKMHAKLSSLNHCAEPFLSRAAVNLCWYWYTMHMGRTKSSAH